MAQDQQSYHRAANAALLGLVAQIVLAVAMALAGLWAQSPALYAATWQFLGGLPIWIILWIIYHQHEIERAETLEVEQIARAPGQAGAGGGAALFETQADELHQARRRLENLYKWGLNITGLVVAGYLLAVGITLFVMAYGRVNDLDFVSGALAENKNPLVLLGVMAALAFLAFIVARYHAGMTQVNEWQLLRAGAGYLISNALLAVVIAVVAVLAWRGQAEPLAYMSLVVPAFMILLGSEILLAFLLGAYRPRKPGEIPRPAFDSRLMGWLTRPEALANSINQALNYQFGIEVSRSWFYRLLSKAITPLLAFGLLVLMLISSVLVVNPEEKVVVTTFGKIDRIVEPGLRFKWPWPIGGAQRYAVGRIQQIHVGSYIDPLPAGRAILWTNQHSEVAEELLITASTPGMVLPGQGGVGQSAIDAEPQQLAVDGATPGTSTGGATPTISLIAAQVSVQYRIVDLKQYVSSVANPQEYLRQLADQRLNRYFATKSIDFLIGEGRAAAGEDLRVALQADAAKAGLGVEIVFVGMAGVHPPQAGEVAAAFHEQVGAIQEKETAIQRAWQDAIQTLTGVAGSVERAEGIARAAGRLEALRREQNADAAAVAQQAATVEDLIAQAPGRAGELIYQARAHRWEVTNTERAKAARFDAQLAAAQKAPRYYRMRMYFDVLGENLVTPRKYIVASEQTAPGVFRLDLKDTGTALGSFLTPE